MNLWRREESSIQKFWVITSDFFEAVDRQNEVIYVSGFIQKELKWLLTAEEFSKRTELFEGVSRFRKIHAHDEAYRLGRELERETCGKISFFDCMRITLSKRLGAVLITRDRMLIETAPQNGCPAYRPEEIKMN